MIARPVLAILLALAALGLPALSQAQTPRIMPAPDLSGTEPETEPAGAPALPSATPFTSTHTDLDLGSCTAVSADDFGAVWACPGYRGVPVRVAEADLRFSVSYGLNSPHEPAARQTLPPVNRLGERIEWRLKNEAGTLKPIATILGYRLEPGSGKEAGEVLVVTQVKDGATCQIALIDAQANEDADILARQAADTAGALDCPQEPEKIGTFSAW